MTSGATTGDTMQARTDSDDLRDRLTHAEPMTDFYRRLRAARAERVEKAA